MTPMQTKRIMQQIMGTSGTYFRMDKASAYEDQPGFIMAEQRQRRHLIKNSSIGMFYHPQNGYLGSTCAELFRFARECL